MLDILPLIVLVHRLPKKNVPKLNKNWMLYVRLLQTQPHYNVKLHISQRSLVFSGARSGL